MYGHRHICSLSYTNKNLADRVSGHLQALNISKKNSTLLQKPPYFSKKSLDQIGRLVPKNVTYVCGPGAEGHRFGLRGSNDQRQLHRIGQVDGSALRMDRGVGIDRCVTLVERCGKLWMKLIYMMDFPVCYVK